MDKLERLDKAEQYIFITFACSLHAREADVLLTESDRMDTEICHHWKVHLWKK